MNVTVVGLGAMGGGMARSILLSKSVSKVAGYDLSLDLVSQFQKDALDANKAWATTPPASEKEKLILLEDYVTKDTDVVVIVLVNEAQCDQVCFGTNNSSDPNINLLNLVKPNGCVFLSSTVTAAWAKKAYETFKKQNIQFVDSPMSGGPVRALSGELTMMVAAEEQTLEYVDPLLKAMGKEIHVIPGGPGMGSTVKMVHQLLAGVHIVVAAEALALAAKAGVDVQQMYDIVTDAAGNSWMFSDRGKRMVQNDDDKVMSALAIFIKDLDIVYSEAKRLQCPVPLAASALQQFISGASMGLGRKDDSQVVKVYETLSGVSLQSQRKNEGKKEGDDVGDLWDGEEILEVGDEPRHHLALSNEYVRVLNVRFAPNDTTKAHRHAEDSLYFFLVEQGLNVINHVQGYDPKCDCMDFGEVRFGTHIDKPLVHKITNKSDQDMFCIDAEVLKSPPVTNPLPLVAEHHTLIKTRDKCRVYHLILEPGQSVKVSYPFFYLSIVLKASNIKVGIEGNGGHGLSWQKQLKLGDLEWNTPTLDMTITNEGETKFEQYIAEWR